jgi:uncharacterized membrane protein YhiD involved in acid resistance
MDASIQLFGYLILTFVGFVAPIVVLTLSIYHEGSLILQQQYASERENAEGNIKEQLKKISDKQEVEEREIKKNLKKLKEIKKNAESKLSYLNPKKQIIKLLLPLGIAFLFVEIALISPQSIKIDKYYVYFLNYFFWLISTLSFGVALFFLWKLVDIIPKVKDASDEKRMKDEQDSRQSMLALLEKATKSASPLLTKVNISVEGKEIDSKEIKFSLTAEEKKDLKLVVINHESKMAKNLEAGIILPKSFIVDKSTKYSIYVDESQQIIRYTMDMLQSKTNFILPSLQITPLAKGEHEITVFIKGENVETFYKKFIMNIV